MSSSGHRYRIRSPSHSPRDRSPSNHFSASTAALPPPNLDASDDGTDSDSDTAVDDSGREGSSTPDSRETSLPPAHEPPPFAGLRDEVLPEQALAATIPYEIILNIFRYLEPFGTDHYNCLYVCKAWTKCAVENVWFRPAIKNVNIFYEFVSILFPVDRKYSTLFPYAQFVRRLNLLNVAKELQPRYFAMLADCTQLERLTMGGAVHINDPAVGDVIPRFKRLLALDLSQVDLGDDGLCAVAESCRLLQGLNVSQCSRLTDISIQAVAENCHNLRRVHLLYKFADVVKTFRLRDGDGCTFGCTRTERKISIGTRLNTLHLYRWIISATSSSKQRKQSSLTTHFHGEFHAK